MLRAYLTRLFTARMLGSLFGLAAILQLLELLDQASTILSQAGVAGILRYLGWRLPSLLTEMIPLSVLLGAMLTFLRLAGSLEMTAMRAAGISVWQVMARLAPAVLLVSAVSLAMQAEVEPHSERGFADWWARVDPPPPVPQPARLWMRSHGDIAAVGTVSLDGRQLQKLMIVQRSAAGDLLARLDAAGAAFRDGRWTLLDVRRTEPGRDEAARLAEAPWPHGPDPANMVELARPVDTLPLGRLLRVLHGAWSGSRGPQYYRTQLEALAASLLVPPLMLLLAAPVLFNPPRRAAGLRPMGIALGLGLLYLTVAGLLEALGGAGVLPPPVAAWAGVVAFGGYGILGLLQAQEA